VSGSIRAIPTHDHSPRVSSAPPSQPVCDRQNCRQIINDLQREIGRLERGTDCAELRQTHPCGDAPPVGAVQYVDRPLYAVTPLGEIAITPRDEPPAETPNVIATRPYYLFTGALIDVLA
jgi:hypothetical protein